MSAPKMMASELHKLIRPALTRPIVNAMEAEELWKKMVGTAPAKSP